MGEKKKYIYDLSLNLFKATADSVGYSLINRKVGQQAKSRTAKDTVYVYVKMGLIIQGRRGGVGGDVVE